MIEREGFWGFGVLGLIFLIFCRAFLFKFILQISLCSIIVTHNCFYVNMSDTKFDCGEWRLGVTLEIARRSATSENCMIWV